MFSRNALSINGDEEEALVLAALQRSPTYDRARTALFRNVAGELSLVDVRRIKEQEQKQVLDKLVNAVNEDIEGFFRRVRQRFDAVGLEFPKVEVRFQNLQVDALVHVGSRALPTIPNFIFDMSEALLRKLGIFSGRKQKFSILKNINGVIWPSRLTLLLGPPSSGKTTFLLALAGRLAPSLQRSLLLRGPQHMPASRIGISEMTVREVLEFSGQCQGPGYKHEMLMELLRREKIAGINPDQDLDIFIKILGLDICADTLVGDEMLKGISGGQKKRLTTAELLMGASRVLFLDEISTGLDSSTTHQIIKYLRHTTHALDCTTLVSLLQPDPETYEMFDDIILLVRGKLFIRGPVKLPLSFLHLWVSSVHPEKMLLTFYKRYSFEFKLWSLSLQHYVQVISEKDQEQYWFLNSQYNYVPVAKFVEAFQSFRVGNSLARELAIPFNKHYNHPAALSTKTYGITRAKLLRISFSWQMLLLKRNSPVFVFKFIQRSAFLPLLDIHSSLLAFEYSLSLVESFLWVAVTYYAIGFDPQITRCLLQFLIYFALHQMSIGLFRVMASLGRNMIASQFGGSGVTGSPPMMYAQNAASVNEFLGHSWDKKAGDNSTLSLGEMLLKVRSLFPEDHWYWIGFGALLGYTLLFNTLFTLFLTHLNRKSICKRKGMVLPFEPLSMCFSNISYYVDIPMELKGQGLPDRLQLLVDVTGAFQPGVLTALIGVSGAGKTTLMDVLAGRKTGGHIEGSIYVSGYPKNQETFARISGYCEQSDVHSPCLTA
ncbi:UNVERIFIED_CONTAM: ABC transporter G family member 32 [Sesamum latifolium]|uniref:ABC transporter G family member 32 n=1 Tax=Sesamum latifolium TaxID=2727402 RepID=A0AAW2SNJ8_9LAMI